jgi:DNA-binding MarR family transcriptional regulator
MGKTAKQDALGDMPRLTQSLRFGFLSWDVARLWTTLLDRALKPLGMTRSLYSVIAFLSRRDGVTQSALASAMELTKAAVGELLTRLELEGLVERRADEADARVRRVYLTRKGVRMALKMRNLANPVAAKMLRHVDEAELDALIQTLSRIKAGLLEFEGKKAPKD